jgi:hypothetical protein
MGRWVAGEGRRVRLGAIYAAHGASHGFVLAVAPGIWWLAAALALLGAAGGVVADRSGLAAVFGFLGLVAVVNTLGGLAVRALLGFGSTGRAPAA